MLFVIASFFLFWCSIKQSFVVVKDKDLVKEDTVNQDFNIMESSKEILSLMQKDNWNEIAQFVHPLKWVRLSPYTFIDLQNSVVLYPNDFDGDLNNEEILWWYTDGAGFEINETKYNYFQKWVYPADFLYANQIIINQKIARWNNLNNIDDVFPDAQSVEYYFDWFDPQYEWLDRMSLTLVFEEYQWTYYLVWIIRGSWTI